jgi:hypothetical protein
VKRTLQRQLNAATPMKNQDSSNLAPSQNFIPGIYNYCDRWCERCPFTARCRSFAMEQEAKGAEGNTPDPQAFWKRLESSLQQTHALLKTLAKERGLTIESTDVEARALQMKDAHDTAEKHPLTVSALSYSTMVDEWFQSGESLLRAKEDEVLAQAKLGISSVNDEVASLTDVVEILRWYQHQIYVKLIRGLTGSQEEEPESELRKDSDGSVKVALIAMDRSIAAWMRMKDFFPEKTDAILTLLVHLDRLRRGATERFPDARSFVRPGFDTKVT